MECPSCQRATRVLESRPAEAGGAVRRRRHCPACGHRFTTYERRERAPFYVRKRDGTRQRFDRLKLHSALARAAHKRPVDGAAIERLVASVCDDDESAGGELGAERIGVLCLEGLRALDYGAYLQYAGTLGEAAFESAQNPQFPASEPAGSV